MNIELRIELRVRLSCSTFVTSVFFDTLLSPPSLLFRSHEVQVVRVEERWYYDGAMSSEEEFFE